ncbi:DNA mismatch repair protein [Suillus ampliporus]|nr:DNA mismatch repair protein [Suillus ampliporus]
MFLHTPTRLSALRSSSEEYGRILDVMTQLYGHSIAKELLHATTSSISNDSTEVDDEDDPESWSAEAYFTNANYQGKKTALLLFINHRLVESHRIKRSIESVYSGILPKGSYPFVYLSINLDPRSVDVNVHPTKREVHFLNEEAIIERISDAIQQKLVGQSQSRVFEYQTLLTGGIGQSASRKGKEKAGNVDEAEGGDEEPEDNHRTSGSQAKKVLSQHKVRTSLQDRTLDSMIPVTDPSRTDSNEPVSAVRLRDIKESACHFASITELRRIATKRVHVDLTEIIKKHTFVGVIDLPRCLTLIQHNKNLYMVNHAALAEEMFYQLALLQFGDYSQLRLDPPPPLRTLVKFAVDAEENTERCGMSKDEIVDRIVKTLMGRREMLLEYFSLDISETGDVKTLPHLLREYTPNLDKLPMFLMRLGPQVVWESEQECFSSFMRELAYFYSPAPLSVVSASASDEDEQEQPESLRNGAYNIYSSCDAQVSGSSKELVG